MKVVWKFDLEIMDDQAVEMPEGAELLAVADQYGSFRDLTLWARVDPDAEPERRVILICGTGHPVGDEPHVGSVITAGGALVWHVFDGGPV